METSPTLESGSPLDDVLEESWADRSRPVRGRELRVELGMTAAFALAVVALVLLAPGLSAPHPITAAVVAAYALAARVEFPIGSLLFVPTQLFLVPLFVLAPAQLVPPLVFGALVVGALGSAALGRSGLDRLVFCAGDAVHALGPALVVVWLAGGDAAAAPAPLLLIAVAFLAQMTADSLSSSLHELLAMRMRPTIHLRAVAQMWSVDAALISFGVLAAQGAIAAPWAALTPLPIVGLLAALATDRTRKIEAAHSRLRALQRERDRLRSAVRRVGDAFASNLDLDALLRIVARAAVETLEGEAVRSALLRGGRIRERIALGGEPAAEAILSAAEVALLADGAVCVAVERDGLHALAARIGPAGQPEGAVTVARSSPFSDEERDLIAYLCEQATVSAGNVARHAALQEAEAHMRHRAFHDPLTGLANRVLFAERVDGAVARHAQSALEAAVLYVDLDGFKLVNDTLGHDTGDELLTIIAGRFDQALRPGDMAARLGGDEFAVLLEALEDRGTAEAIAERLRMEIATPARVAGRDVVVEGSVGVAFAASGLTGEDVLRQADLAMYAAKHGGRHRPMQYQAEMQRRADTRMELAQDLRGAAGRGELELRVQPIIELATGRVHAGEALLRWNHPRRGLLGPSEFIALAEETATIHELGRFALDEGCRLVATWPESVLVNVNVSADQLRSPGFAGEVDAARLRHGVASHRVVLEMTESVLVEPDAVTYRTLEALREAGVTVALDDFGTGYSSLSYLGRLPIDMIKLDRGFMAAVPDLPAQRRLVAGIARLGETLGVCMVAEGIERQAQLTGLMDLGVRLGQGYMLGGPVRPEAFAERLAAAPRVLVATVLEPA